MDRLIDVGYQKSTGYKPTLLRFGKAGRIASTVGFASQNIASPQEADIIACDYRFIRRRGTYRAFHIKLAYRE
jgi:hypothetical protein